MDSNWKNYLAKIEVFVKKNSRVLVVSAALIFVFSLIYSGKIYDIPYFGDKLLANSLERQVSSPQTTELNKLRLKAISDAVKSGSTEYTYEVPALLGPSGR